MNNKSLSSQSAQYVLARGVPGVINLLALGIYTRLLGTDQYGHYTLVIAGVGLLNLVLFNWLKLGLLRFLPAQGERPAALLSSVAAGFLGLLVLTGLAGLTTAVAWPAMPLRDYLAVGLGLLWAMAWLNNSLEMARARLDPLRYGLLSSLKAVLGLVSGGGLAWLGLGAHGVLLGMILANLLPAVGLLRRDWGAVRPSRLDRPLLNEILRYGLPLSVTASLSFVLTSSDRFMIKFILGDGPVGLYAAGYDLAHHVLTVICMTIGLAATPLAINALERSGWDAARAQYMDNGKLFLAVVVPAGVGLFVAGEELVRLVIGVDFQDAAIRIFPWIVISSFFMGLKMYYLDSAFYLVKRTDMLIVTVIPAAVANIVLNLLLIPRLGILGAAYATAISHATALVLTLALVLIRVKLSVPTGEFARTLLASVLMGAALLFLKSVADVHLAVLVVAGVVFYLLIGFLCRVSLVRDLAGIRGRGR